MVLWRACRYGALNQEGEALRTSRANLSRVLGPAAITRCVLMQYFAQDRYCHTPHQAERPGARKRKTRVYSHPAHAQSRPTRPV